MANNWQPSNTDKIYTPRVIQNDPYASVSVDILIPFHGKYQKVYDLCKSLWKTLGRYHDYNICLIDDASPNEFFIRGFEKAPRTTILRSDERLGFGGALNIGFNNTQRQFVMILHSDCIAEHQGWLTNLLKTLVSFKNEKIGMVAPMTNNPVTGPNCLKIEKGKFFEEDQRKDFILKDGFIPLYCALSPREIFSRINGFVKPYPLGWYEDEELSYRMKAYGFKLGVSGKSWIYHQGAETVNTTLKEKPEYQSLMESNREKCILDMQRMKQVATTYGGN